MADALEIKVDHVINIQNQIVNIQTETLNEIKRMNEINAIKLENHDKEFERIWSRIEAGEVSRKKIYERFETIEKTCILNHARKDDTSYQVFDRRNTDEPCPDHIVHTWLGKKLVIALGLILSAIVGGAGLFIFERMFSIR